MQFLIAACLHFALCFYIDYPLPIGYSTYSLHPACKRFVQMSATLTIIDFTEMMQSYMHEMQLL